MFGSRCLFASIADTSGTTVIATTADAEGRTESLTQIYSESRTAMPERAKSKITKELKALRRRRADITKGMSSFGVLYTQCFQMLADRYGVQLQRPWMGRELNGSPWRERQVRQRKWRAISNSQLIADLAALEEEGARMGLSCSAWNFKPGQSCERLGFCGETHLDRLKHVPE